LLIVSMLPRKSNTLSRLHGVGAGGLRFDEGQRSPEKLWKSVEVNRRRPQ